MKLIHGDCIVEMKKFQDNSIDMILCDLPYGTTQNKWDSVIPFDDLWFQYKRIIKNNGAIVLFGAQPFTSALVSSCYDLFKYQWIWQKSRPSGHMNAKRQPLREHEDICVFYKNQPVYNPQFSEGKPNHVNTKPQIKNSSKNYGEQYEIVEEITNKKYPKTILPFTVVSPSKILHPTQKPTALLEYLIKTYTAEEDLVLDNCMGSCSTGIACLNTKRNFIGIEKDDLYFSTAFNRISEAENCIKTSRLYTSEELSLMWRIK